MDNSQIQSKKQNMGEATIRIGDGGTVSVDVVGGVGKACDAFSFIEEALGTTSARDYKPEAKKSPPPTQQNTQTLGH